MNISRAFTCKTTGETYDIHIMGSLEQPLFRAQDVVKVLGDIDVCQDILLKMDTTEICNPIARYAVYGSSDNNVVFFLTKKGLYKLMQKVRKPRSNEFGIWIGKTIADLYAERTEELQRLFNNVVLAEERLERTREERTSADEEFKQKWDAMLNAKKDMEHKNNECVIAENALQQAWNKMLLAQKDIEDARNKLQRFICNQETEAKPDTEDDETNSKHNR